MTTSDPIADMLTRIRNANTAKHDTVDVPASKMKIAIADILVDEGYIAKYDIVEDGNFKTMRITLKYGADKNEKIITGLKRISKPGLRVYAGKDELPRVLGGLGIAILSTNQGIITDKEARKLQVGGEVLASYGRFCPPLDGQNRKNQRLVLPRASSGSICLWSVQKQCCFRFFRVT